MHFRLLDHVFNNAYGNGNVLVPAVVPAVIDVVNPNQFNPLTFSPQVWLDASDTDSMTFVGSNVSEWGDKSGNTNNAANGTGSTQPLYSATALNGKPGLIFNADRLDIPDDPSLDYAAGVTIFIAGMMSDITASSANAAIWLHKWVGGTEYSIQTTGHTSPPPALSTFAGQFITSKAHSSTLDVNTPFVLGLNFTNGDKTRVSRDGGAEELSGGNVTIQNLGADIILGNPFNSEVTSILSEVIIVGEQLSAANRQAMADYLVTKWLGAGGFDEGFDEGFR